MLEGIDKFAQESGSMAKRKRKTRQKSNIIDNWFDKLINSITSRKKKGILKVDDHSRLTPDEVANGSFESMRESNVSQEGSLNLLDDSSKMSFLNEKDGQGIDVPHKSAKNKAIKGRKSNIYRPRRPQKRHRRSETQGEGFSASINNLFDRVLKVLSIGESPKDKVEGRNKKSISTTQGDNIASDSDPIIEWVVVKEAVTPLNPREERAELQQRKRVRKVRARQKREENRLKKKNKKANIWKYLPYEWKMGWETFLFRIFLRSMPHDPWLEDRNLGKEARSVFVLKELEFVFSSLLTFIFAGLTAWLIYQLSVIITASFFGISSVLYYYEVMFPVGNSSPLWTQHSIIMITLSGPLISLILGLVTFFYVVKKKKVRGLNRLFFMWLSFHLFNQFFGSFVAGVITDQGFGYVANWMFMGIILKFAFSVLALFVMAIAGYKVMPFLLTTAGKPDRLKMENRISFVITQAVLPCLIGTTFLLLLRLPNRTPQHQEIFLYDSITSGALLILLVGMFFNLNAKIASVNHRVSNYRVGFLWFIGLLGLIIAFRLGLADGLFIVFRIVFHLSVFN